jgi:hypothetical protein
MKFYSALVVAAMGLACAGCNKKTEPAQPAPSAAVSSNDTAGAAASSQVQTQAPVAKAGGGNPLNAPAEYVGAVVGAQALAVKAVDIASVNSAIQQFNAAEGRYPKDLNELVAERYLVKIPATPPGTQLQYDAAQGTVRIVRK